MVKNENLKKLIKTGVLSAGFSLVLMGINTVDSFAHGYITNSRAALAKYGINVDAGEVQYEPQSIEAKGGFPSTGPVDGQIASAGKFLELDEQSENRWVKIPMSTGNNTFEWTITARHKTSEFKYYITKADWDPNKPLKRDDLEEIAKIDGNNELADATVNHTINIPKDREGYHVILGVWEIADTDNAFYQVIDVDLDNSGVEEDNQAPSAPLNLKSTNQTTNSIQLNWDKSTDNVGVNHYDIYRNNIRVGSSKNLSFIDKDLKANTQYSYIVKAIDKAGNESDSSNILIAKTKEIEGEDTQVPTAPSNLHSMGVTESTVKLHWNKSSDNVLVDKYNIFRNGILVDSSNTNEYTDKNLDADTEYTYTVEAVDTSGNKSEMSNVLKVRTDKTQYLTTWKESDVYLAGDIVLYNGLEYKAKWWTSGDVPGQSDVWELLSKDALLEWNTNIAYKAGDTVVYNNNTYEAKWWVKGEQPDKSSAWKLI